MIENQRRQPGHVFRLDGIAFTGELIESSVDVEGVPQDNDVYDQPERTELVLLSFPLTVENGGGQFVRS